MIKAIVLIGALIGLASPAYAQSAGGSVTDNFGAIAFNDSTGAYGYAYDFRSQHDANHAAMRKCGPGCRVVLRLMNECGALARSNSRYGWSNASNRRDAEFGALRQCGDPNACRVVVWTCTTR